MVCFRRVFMPSEMCDAKVETYWKSDGQIRQMATDRGLASLPVLKGKFYALPGTRDQVANTAAEKARLRREAARTRQTQIREEKLPDEERTSAILNEIFPRSVKKKERHAQSLETLLVPSNPSGGASCLTGGDNTPCNFARTMPARCSALERQTRSTRGSCVPFTPSTPLGSTLGAGFGAGQNSPLGATQGSLNSQSGGAHAAHRLSISVHTPPQASVQSPLMYEFRLKVLQKYSSINEACECFAEELTSTDRGMTKKEWRRVLTKQGFEWPHQEQDAIFDVLDLSNDGHVTLSDLHIAVEAAAPVRSMEDLRRRWLASGFFSMAQAIRVCEERANTHISARLTFDDFSKALRTVNVHDPAEHTAIFGGICSDPQGKVSLEELMAAIATVSPDLLLEDVRQRLMAHYKGNIEKAYTDLDIDRGGTVEIAEFTCKSVRKLGFTENEAKKAFRMIDADSDGEISKYELVSAIAICEPSLFLEDLRLKIRRCFRSITETLGNHFADPLTGELENTAAKLHSERFQELLLPLEFKEAETRTLFNLIDTCREGQLTIGQFVAGIQHFAPGCALEDIRSRCVQQTGHVAETFKSKSDKTGELNLEGFAEALKGLELIDSSESKRRKRSMRTQLMMAGVVVADIFDFLDVMNDGTVTLGRLVAALQSCGAGSRVRPSPEERDLQASMDMKNHLWPKHKAVLDLKSQVRLGLHYDDTKGRMSFQEDEGERSGSLGLLENLAGAAASASRRTGGGATTAAAKAAGRAGSKGHDDRKGRHREEPSPSSKSGATGSAPGSPTNTAAPGGERPQSAERQAEPLTYSAGASAPRLRSTPCAELMTFMDKDKLHALRDPDPKRPTLMMTAGTQDSWGVVWNTLRKAPPVDSKMRRRLEGDLEHYFEDAMMSMSHDVPLISGVEHSSVEQYRRMRAHKAALRMP